MSLPTDVVDYILSFVEVATLQACAQSHPILSELSERHLYSDIILHDELRSPDRNRLCLRISQLAKLLSYDAHIVNYVRNLTIYVRSYMGWVRPINVEDISSMLPMFPQLRKFTVTSRSNCRWQQLPKKFRSAFFDTLNLRPLKDVSIERISGFPLSSLGTMRNLTLDTYTCHIMSPGSPGALHRQGSATLESLSIRNCDEMALRIITSWVRGRRVRSLKFPDLQEYKLLPQLFSGCAESLTSLDLDITVGFRTLFKFYLNGSIQDPLPNIITFPFTLSTAPHLKRLTVRSTVLICFAWDGHPCWGHNSNAPAIAQLITTAPSSLKELMLEIDFTQEGVTEFLPNANVIWPPFTSLATKCSTLSIKVYLSARFTGPWTGPLPTVSSSLGHCKEMTQFVERGVLVLMPPTS